MTATDKAVEALRVVFGNDPAVHLTTWRENAAKDLVAGKPFTCHPAAIIAVLDVALSALAATTGSESTRGLAYVGVCYPMSQGGLYVLVVKVTPTDGCHATTSMYRDSVEEAERDARTYFDDRPTRDPGDTYEWLGQFASGAEVDARFGWPRPNSLKSKPA